MVESGGERARRAVAWIVVALLGLLVAGIFYLHPTLTAPSERSVPRPVASKQVATPVSFTVSFGDAEHGVVQVFSQFNPPNRPPSIYVTSDGGRTWRPLSKFTSPLAAVTFVDRQRMLAEEFGRAAPSLLISDDGGLTWQRLAADPRQFAIRGFWPVFVGSDGWWLDWQPAPGPGSQPSSAGRMWRTSDGGKTWTLLAASGISQFGAGGQLRFIDARHGALAVTLAGSQRLPAVMATEDGGESWRMTATFDTPLAGTRPLGIRLLQHGARLLAWLTVSSWDIQAGPPPGESAVMSTFASLSDDGGARWTPLRPGPVTAVTSGTAAAVDGTGRLLLLDGRRLWISEDDGTTWVARVAAIPAGIVRAFIAAAVPGSVYAMAVRSSDVPGLGPPPAALLRSSDGGSHWTEVHLPRLST